jgi:hypothetical protein
VLVAAILDAGVFADQAMPLAITMAFLGYATMGVFLASRGVRRAAHKD